MSNYYVRIKAYKEFKEFLLKRGKGNEEKREREIKRHKKRKIERERERGKEREQLFTSNIYQPTFESLNNHFSRHNLMIYFLW